jgi:zinc-ribbon domain
LIVPNRAAWARTMPDHRAGWAPRGRRLRRIPLIVAAALALTAVVGTPVNAIGTTPVSLKFLPFKEVPIGKEQFVSATIKPAAGIDPTGLTVRLLINNTYASQTHADLKGNLTFKVPTTFLKTAGKLPLRAEFFGSRLLAPASATGVLTVRPAIVTVITIPPVPGIPISFRNSKATTGPNGEATLSVPEVGPGDLIPHIEQVADPATRVSFMRWGTGCGTNETPYDESNKIDVEGDLTLDNACKLGLRTAYQASVKFVDENNNPIDLAAITRAKFTSSSGQELVLTDFSAKVWWEAGTAVSRTGGLQASTTLWRLAEVTMAGTNVVNSGQQAFTPTRDGTWTISLLLYDLTVRTNDALTGGAVGGTAELVYPDNSSKIVPLDAHGTADFPGLPRGQYTVKLKIGGIAPPTPVALSRSQEATIRVISNVDIAAAVILGVLVLIGLLWIGRRRLGWMRHFVAVPVGVARRVPMPRSPDAARRAGAGAREAIAATAADVARVGRGPGAQAARFGRDLIVAGARSAKRGALAVGRAASSAVRRPVTDTPRKTTPAWPTPQPRPAEASAATAPAANRPVVSRVATSPSSSRPVMSRVATTRPVTSTTTGSSWFDVPGEDEGPTHDCPRCGRAVPDSARFCRSCGHQQF